MKKVFSSNCKDYHIYCHQYNAMENHRKSYELIDLYLVLCLMKRVVLKYAKSLLYSFQAIQIIVS